MAGWEILEKLLKCPKHCKLRTDPETEKLKERSILLHFLNYLHGEAACAGHAQGAFFIQLIYVTPLFCFVVAPRGAVLLSWHPILPYMP